jgi:hypothetical protein
MNDEKQSADIAENVADKRTAKYKKLSTNKKVQEIGGRGGLDPSRFGDWEISGKCVDF